MLRQAGARDKAIAFVDGAISAGKPINPVRDHYIARHVLDATAVETEINALPSINAGGIVRHAGQGDDSGDVLTSVERQTCQRMGIDPKAFAAEKKRKREVSDGVAA